MNNFMPFLFSFFGGGLYALSYPSFLGFEIFPFLFIGLYLFLSAVDKEDRLLRRAGMVFCYNLGLNVFGFYWVPHTLREFGELPYLVSILIGLFFSLILQPHWWVFVFWKRLWIKARLPGSFYALSAGIFLTITERYVPQQFPIFAGSPWLSLAPYLGLAPIFGYSAFSFITYWSVFELIEQRKQRVLVLNWVVLGLFILLNFIDPLKVQDIGESFHVRIVQANIGNFLKVSSEKGDQNSFEAINQTYRDLSTKKSAVKPDLIVWPETAYSTSFYGRANKIPSLLSGIMFETEAEMLIGGYEQDESKSPFEMFESVFNSALLLDGHFIKNAYHKNILIPFGETIPLGPLNKLIAEVVPAISLFAKGEGTPLLETKKHHRFVTPICYEILNSDYMRDLLNQHGGNSFIANLTNDSWYGNTAEPYQHLFLSKWRALEFQLPIIRSTNTGVSSVIYPDGSESKRLEIGEKNYLDVTLKLKAGAPTFYQRFGVYALYAVFVLLAALTWFLRKNGSRP